MNSQTPHRAAPAPLTEPFEFTLSQDELRDLNTYRQEAYAAQRPGQKFQTTQPDNESRSKALRAAVALAEALSQRAEGRLLQSSEK